ncbi:Subtilisin-like protease [Euphorbia peplus]|nr:Subtilisin-like protease [Euphorbia peplus]
MSQRQQLLHQRITTWRLTQMQMKDGFVSARPARMVPFLTTHTSSLLGLQKNLGLWNPSNAGKGVIIGLIDTGITADHLSFSSKGMPPPPANFDGSSNNTWNE